jgi:uncharacterized membrane protein
VYSIYTLAVAVSVSVWFIALRAPLWLDETGSFWVIKRGLSQITHRLILSSPAYFYILWFSTKMIGTSEIALRVPSILAMLGAVYLLYLAARELFERDIAIIAAVIFCLHPVVIAESIDARPYAFAVLATNAAILILLHLRRSSSNWQAALFGLTAAWIIWFHYLFGVIMPALLLCFFVAKAGDPKTRWRQFGVAAAAFALAFLPVIPELLHTLRASETHVYQGAPTLVDLVSMLGSEWLLFILAATTLFGAAIARKNEQVHLERDKILICSSLAFIPILILYGVSVGTSIHCFEARHCLVAIPGISLILALILSPFRSRALRLFFCVAFVAVTTWQYYSSPSSREHGYTWKYALEVAEKNTSADQTPVLVCSDFPEADHVAMPVDSGKDSSVLAQLSYYELSAPVVPLPRALNGEAMRVGSQFLQDAARNHERFLALGSKSSYKTLDWLAQNAAATHAVRNLGIYDGIEVLEFVPRSQTNAPQ